MKMIGPYWVYTHTCPNGMVYVGVSGAKYASDRWSVVRYKSSSLQPYIEQFGWENIEHFFIDGIQTKESALKLEDDLIKMYSEKGCCINKKGSGGWTLKEYYDKNKDKIKEYHKKYYQEHEEEMKEYQKQYREKHKK